MNDTVKEAQSIVTSENLLQFQMDKLGVKEASAPEVKPEGGEKAETNAAEAKPLEQSQQQEEVIPEDGTMDGGRVVFRGKWVDKKDVGYRMHLKTEAAKAEKARADALQAKIDELEAINKKSQTKTSTEKPTAEQFSDLNEYAEAVEKWGREQALREYEQQQKEAKAKEQQEKVLNNWNKQLTKARKEIEDFDEVLDSSPVSTNDFSAEIQAAIVESDIGAQLLYHFAQNPEIVEKLKGLTMTAALREVGKIESKLEAPTKKPEQTKPVLEKPIQKAPAPIKPIGTNINSGDVSGYFDENGEFTGTIAEFKQLRKEGKIK